jgi:hypothetical protein
MKRESFRNKRQAIVQKSTSMSRGLKNFALIPGSKHCLEKFIIDLQYDERIYYTVMLYQY